MSWVQDYYNNIKERANREYEIAKKARSIGLDPKIEVEIPQAEDLAGRVAALIKIDVADKIRELEKEYDRERVAIEIALEVANSYNGTQEQKIEMGIRTALAVLTEGILVAPLEGITGVKIKERDGKNFLCIYYSGPIRSAGGTAQALSVMIGDLIRRKLGIERYIPTEDEIERYKEEIPLYARIQHLQYVPTPEEIEIAIRGSPVCITGEGTEEIEVSGHRDLELIETNRVRGGMALVIAEGLILKASKLKKYAKIFQLEGWKFGEEKKEEDATKPNYNYLKEMVAGRPALSYPSRKGGFRLRYGRGRNTGLAAVAIHPLTMKVLDDFIAIGTQIKTERPGKAAAISTNENIDTPYVLLDDGSLIKLRTMGDYFYYKDKIKEVVDLGEILISFGEFLENNKTLFPGAFTVSWWEKLVRKKGLEPKVFKNAKEAIFFSREFQLPLHPDYTLLWHDLNFEDIKSLRDFISERARIEEGSLVLPLDNKIKRILEDLLFEHIVQGGLIISDSYEHLLVPLGLEVVGNRIQKVTDIPFDKDVLASLSKMAGFPIYAKGPSRIGARMGRPEKAQERSMDPPVHVLFPLGDTLKNKRNFNDYIKLKGAEMRVRKCKLCGTETYEYKCPTCGERTEATTQTKKFDIDIKTIIEKKAKKLGMEELSDFRGVKSLMSASSTPEPLEKGMLRSYHKVYPFKDGTCRYDMSDLPLTHFRPKEIGLSVEKAKELGYNFDYKGKPLVSDEQILEIYPQDIVINERAGDYMVRVSNFIDDLLEKFYGLDKYYKCKSREDLIGNLIIGLAPHTSGGILGRIIGFTRGNVGYAHPFFHAAKRRNCDGDEDSIMLLLDGLINFSVDFLPNTRGSMMDAPLVLSTKINPLEIDKEALNLDITGDYPLELLELTRNYVSPSQLSNLVKTVGDEVKKGNLYPHCNFSDDTPDINNGTLESSYKSIDTMSKKLKKQMELAVKIRAVDENDVAERILKYHFIPDMMGNLRKYGSQGFRCMNCNTKYRRPPLNNRCIKCGGQVKETVHLGNINKYMNDANWLMENFGVSNYVRQRIQILNRSMEELFYSEMVGKDNNVKTLEDFG